MDLNIQLFISPARKGDNIVHDINKTLRNHNTILTQFTLIKSRIEVIYI
jgi:hypothetical protein